MDDRPSSNLVSSDEPSPAVDPNRNDIPIRNLQQVRVVDVSIDPESRIALHTDPRSPGADRFRYLRMRMRELWKADRPRKLLITSPLPGDGKSTIALNVATALAEHGRQKVLLIECDFHHPTVSEILGLESGLGFAGCLEDNLNPLETVRLIEPLSWYLLSAGEPRGNPSELLQSDAVDSVIQKIAPHLDWIVFDAPPIIPLTDASALVRHTDASLLVVRADSTPRSAVEEALKLLGSKHVLGIILNAAEGLNRVYAKYHGYYGNK